MNLALALADMGADKKDLFSLLTKILEENAGNPRACSRFALCVPDYVRREEALVKLEQACAHAGDDPGTVLEIAASYLWLQQYKNAIPYLVKAQRLLPESGVVAALLAQARLMTGQLEDALACARMAWRIDPGTMHAAKWLLPLAICNQAQQDAQQCLSWFSSLDTDRAAELIIHWAQTLEDLRCFPQAATIFRSLQEARPHSFYANARYGELLLKAYQPLEARQALQQALLAKPDDAGVLAALARCHIQLGDLEEAKACLRKSIEANPVQIPAYVLLSDLDASALDGASVQNLQTAVNTETGDREARASGLLALARHDEARRLYDGAFDKMVKANIFLKTCYQERGHGYDPAAIRQEVKSIKTCFNAEIMQRLKWKGRDAETRVFILGMPRSGTTLTEQMLSCHSRIAGLGENDILRMFWVQIRAALKRGESAEAYIGAHIDEWRSIYQQSMPAPDTRADVLIDKLPLNFWHIGLVSILFPTAKIIYAKRCPQDVCLSIFRLRFPYAFSFANDLDDIADYYCQHRDIMAHWQQHSPLDILESRYETLVASPEEHGRLLTDFIGVDWEPACLDFHKSQREVFTLSGTQVRRPIYHSAAQRWKRYAHRLPSSVLNLG